MKIAISSGYKLKFRCIHFLNTLRKHGHEIVDHADFYAAPDADLWIIDYVYGTTNYIEDNARHFRSLLPAVAKFKNNVMLMCLNDASALHANHLPTELLDRIQGIVALNRHAKENIHQNAHIHHKVVLIPRFTIDYRPVNTAPHKINKCFFVGRLTGDDFFNGKNWRIESFKMIHEANLVPDYFEGWLHSIENKILGPKLQNNAEYFSTSQGVKNKQISHYEYLEHLKRFQTSLCLPGNTAWGYRHLDSLACGNTIISFPLNNDSGEWLFQNEFNDSFYMLKPDLSNLCNIIKYAADNVDESIERAKKSQAAYQTHFALLEDNTYQQHVWKRITNAFESIGISF